MANWTASDGTLIHYEVSGSGPTLLLLPGLLGAISQQWQSFMPALAADFRTVLMDLRGHGRSENKAYGLHPNQMVQDIIGLLDHLDADPVHVAGYSVGGYLGLMLALTQPRRVSTLLMHATPFYWAPEAVAQMRRQLDPTMLAEKVPSYANQLAQEHGGGRWRELVRQAADLIAFMAADGLTEAAARHAQCPVLVSVGDRDELVPLPEAHRLSRLFANGGLLVLPHVRHPFNTVPQIPLLPVMKTFHRAR